MGALYTRVKRSVLSLSVLSLSALSLFLSLAGPALAEHSSSQHLVDLSQKHWCYDCVVQVIDGYGIMGGFQDHTFRGDWTVNRYELAATVAKTYSLIKQTYNFDLPSNGFTMPKNPPASWNEPDAKFGADHWAYHYVRKLSEENGLLSKLFDNSGFHGSKVLTRKELAYALTEFLQQMETALGRPLAPERRLAQLSVDADPNSHYQEFIDLALNRYNLMNLHADHTFRPDQAVTRYDMSAALCKLLGLFEELKPRNAVAQASKANH